MHRTPTRLKRASLSVVILSLIHIYRLKKLEKSKLAEQADVDRLEGHSLAAFFYQVIGKMDEKLDKERQEAYACLLYTSRCV